MVEQKSKKFVFNIDKESVSFVEGLSYEKKNSLVNKLLLEYREQYFKDKKNRDLINLVRKIFLIVLSVLAGIPLLIMAVNFCFDATVNSYSRMERNFERLFDEQKR